MAQEGAHCGFCTGVVNTPTRCFAQRARREMQRTQSLAGRTLRDFFFASLRLTTFCNPKLLTIAKGTKGNAEDSKSNWAYCVDTPTNFDRIYMILTDFVAPTAKIQSPSAGRLIAGDIYLQVLQVF
jgi:hypothetical protein